MKSSLAAVAMFGALALAGCDAANSDSAPVDTAAIEQQIKGLETIWNQAYAARDAEALAAMYSADAALANPGMALATDSASRRKDIAQFAADPNLKVDFASDRVQVAKSGELAYSRGHFTMQSSDPATKQPRTDSGSYLTVWQKQADGGWKAVEDFVVPGAPAAG